MKKFTTIVLIVVLALSLFACGGGATMPINGLDRYIEENSNQQAQEVEEPTGANPQESEYPGKLTIDSSWETEGIKGYIFQEQIQLWEPVKSTTAYAHPSANDQMIPMYGDDVWVIPFEKSLKNITVGFGAAPYRHVIGTFSFRVKNTDFSLPTYISIEHPPTTMSPNYYTQNGLAFFETVVFSSGELITSNPNDGLYISDATLEEGTSRTLRGFFLFHEPLKTPNEPNGAADSYFWQSDNYGYYGKALFTGITSPFPFGLEQWNEGTERAVAFVRKNNNGELFLTASASQGYAQSSMTVEKPDTDTVNVYNWAGYINIDILNEFEQTTGIKVNYNEFQSNDEMYSVMKHSSSDYDVVISSDYMISRLINENMLEKLDYSNIPNYALVGNQYKNIEYDPTSEYSVPYMSGTVGIIYNSAMITDEVTSWGSLFDSKYAGQILMFNSPRDALGIALKYLGYSLNTTDEDELKKAFDIISDQTTIIQAGEMDQIFDKLESGEGAIGPYYAGDFLIMRENNSNLKFVHPEEGANWFVDAMCIPKGSTNKINAEVFINFMCSTDVCVANMDITGYASANTKANEKYSEYLTPEDYDIVFASKGILAKCEVFIDLPTDILALYDLQWSIVR